jgi:2-phospho-L-lactate guanylyltransferase
MIDWGVLVPIKQGNASKSRLGDMLEREARSDLAGRMADHVLGVLTRLFAPHRITILSPIRLERWSGGWVKDEGVGLNAELSTWRAAQGQAPVLILFADLPLLSAEDVTALLDLAAHGAALATDRWGQGTNALAIADGRPLTLSFGKDSRALHCAQYADIAVLRREGLMADLDTPDDVAFARARGFVI